MAVITVRAFSRLMRQTATIAPRTGYDEFGKPAFGTPVTYRGAYVGQVKLVRDQHGKEVPSRGAFYMMSNAAISAEDQVTLSTGDVGSTESYAVTPKIVSVERYPFVQGQFCTVVLVG